jgi:hypothetical protein
MGALYILNPTTSSLALAINEERAGSLRSCSSPGYQPSATSLEITRREEQGTAHLGQNTLLVTFESEPRIPYLFRFTLDPSHFSIKEDVVSFAMRGYLLLTAQSGTQLTPNPLLIPGSPLHPTD